MRILRELRAEIGSFLDGQEHGVCVLHGASEHMPFAYRLLQEFEDASADVFLPFPHQFESADHYVDSVVERIEASGQEARGDAGWSLPPACRDRDYGAVRRLREALVCARAMLPRGRETPRLVVVLCPLEVTDEPGYRALVHGLIQPQSGSPPWFSRMRIFVHATSVDGWQLPARVRALKVDLSPAVMAASAANDAEDPALSREQRAQALLQAAMLDVGHRRFESARTRLDALFGEAQALKSPALTALALSGLGDVERLAGDRGAAIGWYERALAPAGEAGAPVILLMVTRYLAELYYQAERSEDAEVFYDGAQRLAAAMPEPETQALSLVGRGLAQRRRGAVASEWAASFIAAGEVARDCDRADLLPELHPHLTSCRHQRLPEELQRSLDRLLRGGA